MEHNFGTWQRSDIPEYHRDGFARQIRHNSEPTKECRPVEFKTGGG